MMCELQGSSVTLAIKTYHASTLVQSSIHRLRLSQPAILINAGGVSGLRPSVISGMQCGLPRRVSGHGWFDFYMPSVISAINAEFRAGRESIDQ